MKNEWTIPVGAQAPVRAADAPAPGTAFSAHWHKCFGCRSVDSGGLGMTFEAGEGVEVIGRVPVDRLYEGGPGVIHGGVLATIFDDAMGAAARLMDIHLVTAHLQVDYARPVVLDTELVVPARVDAIDRRKVFVSAEAYARPDYERAAAGGPPAEPLGSARALFIVIDLQDHFKDSIAHTSAL